MTPTSSGVFKILDSIPKFDIYSKYNIALERVFQDNSMKHLMKSLKEHKRAEVYSYFTENEKVPKNNKLLAIYGIENKKEDNYRNLLNDEEKEKKPEEKQNIDILKGAWRITNTSLRPLRLESDPFRYNPNYNSIYKNIPSVKIRKPIFER